jgi:hypothetical protein
MPTEARPEAVAAERPGFGAGAMGCRLTLDPALPRLCLAVASGRRHRAGAPVACHKNCNGTVANAQRAAEAKLRLMRNIFARCLVAAWDGGSWPRSSAITYRSAVYHDNRAVDVADQAVAQSSCRPAKRSEFRSCVPAGRLAARGRRRRAGFRIPAEFGGPRPPIASVRPGSSRRSSAARCSVQEAESTLLSSGDVCCGA